MPSDQIHPPVGGPETDEMETPVQAAFERQVEHTLHEQVRWTAERRERQGEVMRRTHEALFGAQLKSPEVEAAAAAMRTHVESMAASTEATAPSAPGTAGAALTFVGGASLAPPYKLPFAWRGTYGGPIVSVIPDPSSGTVHNSTTCDVNGPSGASTLGGVGPGLLHPFASGLLTLTTTLVISYSWQTVAWLASTHSDGFVGFWVIETDFSGSYAAIVLQQRLPLWADDSYWSGGGGNVADVAVPVATQLLVDTQHLYQLWVIAGTNDFAEGFVPLVQSSHAMSDLFVRVPYMTWQLEA